MIQALFFDAAGTLIEPAEPVAETYSRLLSPHIGALDRDQLAASFVTAFKDAGLPNYGDHHDGDDAEREWWRVVVESAVGRPVSDEAFLELFEHYAKPQAWRIFPEVGAVLERARKCHLRTAVVSNFDLRLHRILDALGLEFERVMTSADARARKPSDSIFNQTLQLMKLDSDQVLHVGDSEQADLKGAKSAGIAAFLLERRTNDLSDFMDWAEDYLQIG